MQTLPSFHLCSSSLISQPIPRRPISQKHPSPASRIIILPPKTTSTLNLRGTTHVTFSTYPRDESGGFKKTHASESELELLSKPSHTPITEDEDEDEDGDEDDEKKEPVDVEEALKPFIKFFIKEEEEGRKVEGEEAKKVMVDYYEPKSGDFAVGVVVSGNERKLDVNVGADMLATMLTKEVMPLSDSELRHGGMFDPDKDAEELAVRGKIMVVKDEEVWRNEEETAPGRPLVEPGTLLFAEVLGRTLSGRPLLSSRKLFRRLAWHRVRQIEELNEPIEVIITEWNTGGLITRIEGLRAFLPKDGLMNKANNFTDLKKNVGRRMHVLITLVDEAESDLRISEKVAWEWLNLREGTLLEGTVRNVFTFGAQVMIGETNRSGLLHVTKISRVKVESVSDLIKVGEKLKVLVIKSKEFPEKISFSIADLESERGLFLKDKEKVFSEAEEMAKQYRRMIPKVSVTRKRSPQATLPFDDETKFYANWKWFTFKQNEEQNKEKTKVDESTGQS